jgi:hypothetical protein
MHKQVGGHLLTCPDDLDDAIVAWGANCGPAALAVIAGRSMAEVRPCLGLFEKRGYMNPTHMWEALNALRVHHTRCHFAKGWPVYGLAFIQFKGSWDNAPVRVQYRHTHWIAVAGAFVFDINNERFPWYPREHWESETVQALLAHNKGTGFYVRHVTEIRL